MPIALLVLVRIVVNPLSNVFQKRLTRQSADPLFLMAVTFAAIAIVCAPVLWLAPMPSSRDFWIGVVILCALDVAGNALLVEALEITELSVFGPLNAYKAVVSLVFAVVLIHEVPRLVSLAGVAMIVGASVFLNRPRAKAISGSLFAIRGVRLRLLSLVILSGAAVYLKKTILLSSPGLAFALEAIGSAPLAIIAVLLLRRGRIRAQWSVLKNAPAPYAGMVATFGLAELCVVFTFRALPVGVALALFQTSTLLSVFFGHRYFAEQGIRRKLAASAVMIAGAILTAA